MRLSDSHDFPAWAKRGEAGRHLAGPLVELASRLVGAELGGDRRFVVRFQFAQASLLLGHP